MLFQGLTGLGISLLGAVGGIAHHPLNSLMTEGASPRGLVTGVGVGLVGVIAKPLSGAADLVALAGEGLLQGAGWNPLPKPRTTPATHHTYSAPSAALKYTWKFLQTFTRSSVVFITEATWLTGENEYRAVALILTTEYLIIANTDEDVTQRIISLPELNVNQVTPDPTLLSFRVVPVLPPVLRNTEEEVVEMDPACRARVVDYVRSTVGLVHLRDDVSPAPSEMGATVSRCGSPGGSSRLDAVLNFYVSPQNRNYFLAVMGLAQQQRQNCSFPVL